MHLLGWFNVAAEGLAVTYPSLARAADVDVFERGADGYQRRETVSLTDYLDRMGYDVIAADPGERWPTNFVAIDDGLVVPLYEPPREQPDHRGARRAWRDRRPRRRGVADRPADERVRRPALHDDAGQSRVRVSTNHSLA